MAEVHGMQPMQFSPYSVSRWRPRHDPRGLHVRPFRDQDQDLPAQVPTLNVS